MSLDNELKSALDSMTGEAKALFAALQAKYDSLDTQHKRLQTQVDAIDSKSQVRMVADFEDTGSGLKVMSKLLTENKDMLAKHGRYSFEIPTLLPERRKSTILSTGLTSAEPAVGIAGAGRFPYRLRTLFRSVPTDFPSIGVLRTTAENLQPSPQQEGQPKSESTLSFELVQVPIQVLATFVHFSRQAMEDINGFEAFINATLVWALERKAEVEILSGSGTGVHLPGLMTDAEAFDTTILTAGGSFWNRVDVLGAGAVQLQEAGYSPDFAVVSPRNWFRMVSQQGSDGQYTLNNPRTAVGQRVYDLEILPSNQMLGDGFLVGDSSQAVIRQRMKTTVDISFEHGSNFTSNLATALAEERLGIQTLRPDAYVTGTLLSSPA